MIEVVATLTGVLSGVIGTFLAIRGHMTQVRRDYEKRLAEEMNRQSEARVKEYAAQRDFEYLARNHEQLKEVVNRIDSDVEKIKDTLLELQVTSRGAFNRMEQIAAKLEAGSLGNMPRQQ